MKILVAILFNLCLAAILIGGSNDNERKPYIVYMGEISAQGEDLAMEEQHHGMLTDAIGDESIAREAKMHSYGRSFNGFVARLLPHEASRLSEKSAVVSVFPNTMRKLLTTRSWDFLGMPQDLKQRNHATESDTIVGLLDTGIYVDAPSFSDEGYGPPPAKWKGKCQKGQNFTGCNRKVIGATYYSIGHDDPSMDQTPADKEGHGTHTSSTAAGGAVKGASLYGLAEGTARGGVPGARIAMYKVCSSAGCSDMNLLAGFDDAIADGVDVISVSISGPAIEFFKDAMAIGSFHAMKKGISTVCAAGNTYDEGSVENVAPWIFTVAASNLDREFKTKVKLGNGLTFYGTTINTFSTQKAMYPLTSSAFVYNATVDSFANASTCTMNTLSNSKVKGKIILCLSSHADMSIRMSKGAGTIMVDDGTYDTAFTTLLPATVVSAHTGRKIAHYINTTTKSARALIYKTITLKTTKAPVIAKFSSKGPQKIARNILKPDITAPGVDILAGYSKLVSITGEAFDSRVNSFNVMSGTSMACPHVAAAIAYVKTFHPDWSPAAIKSALMTTSRPVDGSGTENPLHSGSGLLNPVKAVNPGLVYDLSTVDYLKYLCKEGYNTTTIASLSGAKAPHVDCSKLRHDARGIDGLNYPSMHLQLLIDDWSVSTVFHRTVTHVGHGPSLIYKAKVMSLIKGISFKVVPDTLLFTKKGQKKSFRVVVKGEITEDMPSTAVAFLEWSDAKGSYKIRSPILIYKPIV